MTIYLDKRHLPGANRFRFLSPSRLRRKGILSWALSFFLALSLLSGTLFGAEHTPRKVVRIPSTHFNRLMMVDGNNEPVSGYAYDYIQAIATYARWDVQFVPCHGFADCVEKLLAGEVDLFYDVSYTEERAKAILYPDEPMGTEYYYLYSTIDNKSFVDGDDSTLNGRKTGVTAGTMEIDILKDWCERKGVNLDIIEYRTVPEKEADLAAGKIDLDLEVSMLAKHNLSAVEKVGSSAYYLVANKSRPDLIADINSALGKVLKNDIYYLSRLEERYFSDTVLSRSLSAEERNWLDGHKTFRVGYFDNYLPFSSRDKDGRPFGAAIDIMREIVKALNLQGEGVNVEFVCYGNQQEGFKALESGEVDMIIPVYVSKSVQRDYRIIGGKIFATFSSDIAYSSTRQRNGYDRFGVNRNNMLQYYYTKDAETDSEIVFYDSIEACLDGLLEGTCDATFLNGFRSDPLLKHAKYHSINKVQAPHNIVFRMAFAEDDVSLMLLMDRGLTILEPELIEKSLYYYVGQMYSMTVMDYIAEHMVAVMAIAAFVVAMLVAIVGFRVSNAKLSRINRKLEDALHRAQVANKAKTTFLSNMSHDIRTPMNAIIGFADIAAGSIDDKARVKDCLSTISSSSEYLLSLIDNVLDMSRIEAGKLTLNEKPESLGDMLCAIEEVVQADVQARRHNFSIDMADVRDDVIVCDKTRLMQVLINLVSNAIKYTNPGGTISLTVARKPSAQEGRALYEFRVKDNGIGIDEEFIKTIFDAFTRERNTTASGIQGTGLGMAITKNLVDKMGGKISLASKKGEGTEFLVAVEFKLAERKDAVKSPDAGKMLSLEGKKVLLVDDSSLNRKVAMLQFRKHGAIVDMAEDGKIAVDMIREKGASAYDFVLMDVQMPVMDGYEATAEIRKLPGGDKLPIIAYSANAFEEDKQESLKAGMNGHLTKPLKIDELLAALGRFLVFALCIFPGFGAFATEDECVDLAPAGPVEGFESEDSGVEGVRKWLGLHAYADIESAYIIRGYVWDSRPCSMQFADAELKLGEYGRFDGFVWSMSALSSRGHSGSMRNAYAEVDYGIRYIYDLRLADEWTLQNGVARQWITNPGVRHNSRSLNDWQVFQSLNNPYVTPYWKLRFLWHPYRAAYWCVGLFHTFELTETLSFTIDGFGDLEDARHGRHLFGPKPDHPGSKYNRGLYALNLVLRLDWQATEYLGFFAFVGQYCLVDRDARDAVAASSADESKRDLTFGGVGLKLDF